MSDATAVGSLSAAELASRFRAGELRPGEALESVLALSEAWEPRIHAFASCDPERARAAAAAADARFAAGEPLGPLDGVPVTIKENVATAGDAVRLGSAATPDQPAPRDAPAAARLREVGAVIVAKTTMPDFGMLSSGVSSLYETTRSPWNAAWNPGGSSAGAGAAAAAGLGPIHVGTDIGGSIRLPAGWCGVFGLKPSFGRVPVVPPYYARCVGPLARTVDDLARAMSVLSLPDARDHTSLPYAPLDWEGSGEAGLRGVRIGLVREAGAGMDVDPEVLHVLRAAATACEAAGAAVEPAGPLIDEAMLDGLDRFWRMRSHLDIQALAPERRERILPYILEWTAPAADYSAEQVFTGFGMMDAISVAAGRALAGHDFLLTPVAPIATFDADRPGPSGPERSLSHIGFTVPFSMSGHPALSVPWGAAADGRPIGVQLVGPRHADVAVLALGRALERIRPAQPDWPSPG